MNSKELAHSIVKEATDANNARESKIKAIASKLAVSFEKAESLVRQEEARIAASKKYRQSEAYKNRLEQQKLVRQMMKNN